MDNLSKALGAILVVAILAVIVSNRSKTTAILSSAWQTFDGLITVVVSPIQARQQAAQNSSSNSGGGLLGNVLDPTQLVSSIDPSSALSFASSLGL